MAANATDISSALRSQLNESLGAIFLGLVISASFFGVTNVQVFLYFQKSDRDPRTLRGIIAILWCLDALHLVFASHAVYTYLVSNFANVAFTTVSLWSLVAQVPVSAISDLIVQSFYCRRLWIMSQQNKLLTGIAVLLTVLTFAFSMTFGIRIFFYASVLDYGPSSWALYAALGTAVIADLWIALSLCYFLLKSKTGWKATDTTATRLMIYIVNTGLLTSIVAIGCFVTYAAIPTSYVYIAFYFSYSKLYFNALLAMLNARQRLRGNLGTNAASTSPFRSSIMKSTSDSDDSTFRMSHIFSKNNRPRDRPQSRIVEGSKSRPPTISIDRLESGLGFSAADCAGTATSDSKFSTFKDDSSFLALPTQTCGTPKIENIDEDGEDENRSPAL